MRLLALIAVAVLFTSCSKDPREDPSAIEMKDIVGRWKNKHGNLVMEFRDNGFYCVPGSFTGCNDTAMRMNDQTWNVSEGKLVWKDMENVLSSAKRVATVTKYTGNELYVTLEQGRPVIFVRQ